MHRFSKILNRALNEGEFGYGDSSGIIKSLPDDYDGYLYKVQLIDDVLPDPYNVNKVPGYTFTDEPDSGLTFSRMSTYNGEPYALVYKMKAPEGLLMNVPSEPYPKGEVGYYDHNTGITPGWFKDYSGDGIADMAVVTIPTEMSLYQLYNYYEDDVSKGIVYVNPNESRDSDSLPVDDKVFGLTDDVGDRIKEHFKIFSYESELSHRDGRVFLTLWSESDPQLRATNEVKIFRP